MSTVLSSFIVPLLTLLFFVPPGVGAAGALLVAISYPKHFRRHWWCLLLGVVLLVICVGWVAKVATIGSYFSAIGGLQGLLMVLAVLVTAAFQVWQLPRWWKLSSLGLAVLFPLALYIGYQWGYDQTFEAAKYRDRDTIVVALGHYYADHQAYPATLHDLIPDYLPSIPGEKVASTAPWPAWQYTSNTRHFVFSYIEIYGSAPEPCIYTSESTDWQCPYLSGHGAPPPLPN